MASRLHAGFAVAAALALGACGSSGMFGRDAPDEFAISRTAPLVVPPDFNMAPPRPGAPRPMDADSQTQAIEALFGPGVRVPPASPSEQLLLDGAKATRVDPTARSTVGDPETQVVDKGALLKTIIDSSAGDSDAVTAALSIGG